MTLRAVADTLADSPGGAKNPNRTEAQPAPGMVRPSEDLSKDRLVTFDEAQGSFVTVTFPTAYPSSRCAGLTHPAPTQESPL